MCVFCFVQGFCFPLNVMIPCREFSLSVMYFLEVLHRTRKGHVIICEARHLLITRTKSKSQVLSLGLTLLLLGILLLSGCGIVTGEVCAPLNACGAMLCLKAGQKTCNDKLGFYLIGLVNLIQAKTIE